MGVLLNLKNLFTKSKEVKIAKQSITRSKAEEQLKTAKSRGRAAHLFGGARDRDLRAIYFPQDKRHKGYARENRRTDRGHGYKRRLAS
jgi:hypothetical protein